MQHVLVHIDHGQNLGPIGAWGYIDGRLTHFYPESLDVGIPARARQYMLGRDPATTSVPTWFDLLMAHTDRRQDEFQAIEVNDDVTLPSIVAEFRRHWSSQRTM